MQATSLIYFYFLNTCCSDLFCCVTLQLHAARSQPKSINFNYFEYFHIIFETKTSIWHEKKQGKNCIGSEDGRNGDPFVNTRHGKPTLHIYTSFTLFPKNVGSHYSKGSNGLEQNGTHEKKPFSSLVFYALSNGVICFIASVGFKKH